MHLKSLLVPVAAILMAACNGGGDGASGVGTGSPTSVTVTGGVVKGPVSGATVCVFALSGGVKGAQIPVVAAGGAGQVTNGCYITPPDGSYQFALSQAAPGDVLIEATGGQFCSNEQPLSGGACPNAGVLLDLGSAVMKSVVSAQASAATVYTTPLSTAAVNGAGGSLSSTTFNSQFTTLSGQLSITGVTPASAPDRTTQPYLLAIANHLRDGGSLASVVSSLGQGTTTFPATTASRVFSAAPLAIYAGTWAATSTSVRVTASNYNATFTTNDAFSSVSTSAGSAVSKLEGKAFLHCPLGAGGTLAALQAGRVILSPEFVRVTNYDELLNKTFDEFNCGGRFQPVRYNADGSVTLTFQDSTTEDVERSLWAQQFTPEGFHFVGNGEDNRHYAEIYKVQTAGGVRYVFLIRNDENLSTGPEQSVALFVQR